MAYVYDENTGNFIEKPSDSSPSGGSPGGPSRDNWKKWLKIAGKVAIPVISVAVFVATGVSIPGND